MSAFRINVLQLNLGVPNLSNASLKEQLQALSIAPTSEDKKDQSVKKQQNAKKTFTKPNSPKKPSTKNTKSTVTQKPAWLEYAQYGVELLKAHFPNCFKEIKEVQPLKIGIKQDLVKLLSTREDIVTSDKACMVSSIAYYVNSASYHKSIIEGASRIDLEGQAVGVVSAEEAKYSTESRKAKLLKKKIPQQTAPAVSENKEN